MEILIVYEGRIPVTRYGGIQRVIWSLGKELVRMGHGVKYLVDGKSICSFAKVIPIDRNRLISEQIPDDTDIVHFNLIPKNLESIKKPYIVNMQTNTNDQYELDVNTVFVSANHASRYGSDSYVHNGLDWDEYDTPSFSVSRDYFHFLGDAAWRLKNVRGAINTIRRTKSERIRILGGYRFNVKRGLRFTWSGRALFHGMVGGQTKHRLLNYSKGMVFPVRWDEPFGIAMIESLYYGCPVFGTPYGSLPEIITPEIGFLSNNCDHLAAELEDVGKYSHRTCHQIAVDLYNSRRMARAYLQRYEKVLAGDQLNAQPPRLQRLLDRKFLEWIE
jgi:glycosyltransferase involved in cell wall biosynthesis